MPLNVMVDKKLRPLDAGSMVSFQITKPDMFEGFMVRIEGCEPCLICGLGEPKYTSPTDTGSVT